MLLPLILGLTKTPFAVKGGGHSTNPGFSSTTGVQISMTRFREVVYDAATGTVRLGTGLLWDDVYAALKPHGVGVVGGRVSGVGVAGFSLGGGYGWTSNEHGLTVDTITEFELVKPDGTIVTVTHNSDPELFFGLKGGQNNFGIVTRLTLKTHPQGLVWGGSILYPATSVQEVLDATNSFIEAAKDIPKATLINSIGALAGVPLCSLLLFYNGPEPPAGLFDAFLRIPLISSDIGTKDFGQLVASAPAQITTGLRGVQHSVPTMEYSPAFIQALKNETEFWAARNLLGTGVYLSYAIQPYLPSVFDHKLDGLDTAYPPASSRSKAFKPTEIYYAWAPDALGAISLLQLDRQFHEAARQSARHLSQVAEHLGQNGVATGPVYPNYAIFSTPLERLYGENVGMLKALKKRVDPQNVMGLAGGFKF